MGILGEVTGAEGRVELRRTGSFGELTAALASPLVLVLAELVHNAVEHGFGDEGRGTVEISATRDGTKLAVAVIDDGAGLPPGFDPSRSDRLGLQIVRTLADADLHTSVDWRSRAGSSTGTLVTLRIDLAHDRRDRRLSERDDRERERPVDVVDGPFSVRSVRPVRANRRRVRVRW